MLWRKDAPEGGMVPSWYGMAYFSWDTRTIVAYPLGLHWLMGFAHIAVWHIKYPPWRHYTTSREYPGPSTPSVR